MKLKLLCGGLLALPLILVFAIGATRNANLAKTRINGNDQDAYVDFVEQIYRHDYQYLGDRNRMPVYPYIQAAFANPQMSTQQIFDQGKLVNIGLAIVLLLIIYLILLNIFSVFDATLYILISTFTLFILRAGYVQTELLYYTLFFILFLVLTKLSARLSWKWAFLAGVITALSQLTKASALFTALLFLGIFAMKLILFVWTNRRQLNLTIFRQSLLRFLVIPVALICGFVLPMLPYMIDNVNKFGPGQFLYNVNTNFYVWYDSWAEAEQGTKQHGDRIGWPQMPAEQIPSLGKYLREHTPVQIIKRELNGLRDIAEVNFSDYSLTYSKYLVIFAVVVLLIMAFEWRHYRQLISQRFWQALFAGCFLVFNILIYAWYNPIGYGPRFTMALFLPILFVLFYLTSQSQLLRKQAGKFSYWQLINLPIVLLLIWDIYYLVFKLLPTTYLGA